MDWVPVDALTSRLPGFTGPAVVPNPRQDLTLVPSLVEAAFAGEPGPLRVGGAESVIVLALDGVGYDAAHESLRPPSLYAITSTFPSTSTTAWLSATTGAPVAEHGVPGVVFRSREAGGMFHSLADRILDLGEEWDAVPSAAGDVVARCPTMFERLSRRGVECVGFAGDLEAVPGRWSDAVVRGMRRLPASADWDRLRRAPLLVAGAVAADVDAALVARAGGRPMLLWTYVHVDPYLHDHGVDGDVHRFLRDLAAHAERWASAGHTVVAHSDHGITATASPPEVMSRFDEIAGPRSCRLPAGGAGRVRWVYPREGGTDEVADRLRALLGDDAFVCSRDDLDSLGVLAASPLLRERVGEVVVLATATTFPLPDPTPFEHGSLTPEEMLVPFATWGGA